MSRDDRVGHWPLVAVTEDSGSSTAVHGLTSMSSDKRWEDARHHCDVDIAVENGIHTGQAGKESGRRTVRLTEKNIYNLRTRAGSYQEDQGKYGA